MASSSAAAGTKEIVAEIPRYIHIYKDGTVERRRNTPFVPPSLDDPQSKVSSQDIVISHDPSISARLYLPKLVQSNEQNQNQKLPILVYFHGGGFFFESPFSQLFHNYFNKFISQANLIVVSVDYRLAPEHLLPAAYDDCWDALKWVASHSMKCPIDTAEPWLLNHGDFSRIFLGGDSAGGNIVHNIAMRAGVENLPGDVKIFGAFLAHPYFYGSEPIGSEPAEGHEQSLYYLVWKLVNPSAPGGLDNPMINPMVFGAPSLAGLGCSKMLVCVAGRDAIRDRAVLYFESVKKSGWEGELEQFEVEDEDHIFHILNPDSENSEKMMKRLALFLLEGNK